jgi:[protein-PII] uridylyltransferase
LWSGFRRPHTGTKSIAEPTFPPAPKRLKFTGEVPLSERLAEAKAFLRDETAALRERHERGASGLDIAHGRAATMDALLGSLFAYALASFERRHGPPPAPVALVALGGYGRGELSPWSDLDLMFLFPSKTKPAAIKVFQEHLTQEILYILWDCGLKVGHSTRTVDQVFAEARRNLQSKTALLESRFLAGSLGLYDSFAQAYRTFYTSEAQQEYIAARLEDQAHRRAKFSGIVFNQEPDVKSGVGGLRDYQNALWMARVKLGITEIDDLATQNHLRAEEVEEFKRAYGYLLRVRNELHFLSSRATDVLNLDQQPRVAWDLGYRQENLVRRVERFMQDYYRAAQSVFRISKLVESRLALSLRRDAPGSRLLSIRDTLRAGRSQRRQRLDGFVRRGRELAAETPNVFVDDPVRMIRVFRHCQQLDCAPDFHLLQLIRESLPLMANIAQSEDAGVCFRTILADVGNVHGTLTLMHELGVLGRFIPEFDALTCLVQHELYHRYTADYHTLNTIQELDRIFTDAEPIALKYRDAIHETADPSLAYLTLLLHDIGKAAGIERHSESGARLAGPILDRLGLAPDSRNLVLFVIKNHLAMARFWQKRDVDDPRTSSAFAELVGDAERLRSLYVHTFCDSRGTAADFWNSYKDALHTKLYENTLERLELGDALDATHAEKKTMTQEELIGRHLPGISDDEIVAHFSLLPDRYFVHTDADEVSLHVQMVHRLLASIANADSVGSLRPVVDWHDDLNRSFTVVNVVTWDRAGLFYKLAGAFSVAGLNILGAKIISRTDHIAIDSFYVIEPGRGVVQSSAAQEAFTRNIEAALVSNKDLYPEILAQARKIAATRYLTPGTGLIQSSFPPTVEVYHELSMQRTIVEVQARDQIGLLYRLAKTISDHRFDITFARVGTERGMAIDTFYIESENHEPVEDAERLRTLRDALAEVIAPAPWTTASRPSRRRCSAWRRSPRAPTTRRSPWPRSSRRSPARCGPTAPASRCSIPTRASWRSRPPSGSPPTPS